MHEIDMNKIDKCTLKELLKDVYKNPCTYLLGATFAVGTTITSTYKNPILYVLLANEIYIISNLCSFLKNNESKKTIEVQNFIRETVEYKKSLKLYREYLNNIKELLQQFNFLSSIDLTIYIDKLIQSGALSKESKFKYKIYKHGTLEMPELLGARITSGTGVCRHIAGLSRDILQTNGIKALELSAMQYYGEHPEILTYFKATNHAIVGVIDENEKYIFDPTSHDYATSTDKYSQNKKYTNSIAKIIPVPIKVELKIDNKIIENKATQNIQNIIEKQRYYYIKNNPEKYGYSEYINLFNKATWKNITLEELEERKTIISKLFKETEYERKLFYNENKSLMTELAHMDLVLSPYSDEEKPRWVLHKK